jgi:ribosomal protein L11 methyltransferase
MSLKIGNRFEIFRDTESIETNDRIPIILGTGRAFGSGEHETTWNCLEEMENISSLKDAKVLDIGCGTGILSIAAAKLGAKHVTALDPNPNAITVTKKSIELNNMGNIVIPIEGELDAIEDGNFDVILANLYGDILLSLADGISKRLAPGGYALLSGILYEYTYDVKSALTKRGCETLKERYLEEYSTLLLRK